MEHPINKHIMDEAIAQAVANYQSCITNLLHGHIKNFRVRFLAYDRRRYVLKLEKLCFNGTTFCQKTFGEVSSSEPLTEIEHTVTLQYDRDIKKYFLLVPTSIEIKEYLSEIIDCGIDLGVRTFATVYSCNEVLSIGNELCKKLKVYHKKIDKINELLQVPSEEQRTVILTTTEVKRKRIVRGGMKIIKKKITKQVQKTIKRFSLIKALRKYNRRIKNMVREMHYKAAYYLVTRYDNIYIGKLSTKRILSKNNRKITKKTKRMVGTLSPSLFRRILKYMGDKYGSNVYNTNEYLTTQTCSNCGRINKIGRSKTYKCAYCDMITDRDVNSSKDMLKVGYANGDTDTYLHIYLPKEEDIEITYVNGNDNDIIEI